MRQTLFTLKLNSIDLLFQKKIKLFSRILVFLQFFLSNQSCKQTKQYKTAVFSRILFFFSNKTFARPPPVVRPSLSSQPSTSAATRQRRPIFKDDFEEPDEEEEYTPTRTTRRGRVIKEVIKEEYREEYEEYKPTKKTKKAPVPQPSPKGVRKPYRKSQKQREKEMAAAKRNARLEARVAVANRNVTIYRPPAVAVPSTSTFDPLDTSNSDFDPLDPLAMNDDPLIDNVSIKTEFIDDDNPPTIQNDLSMDGIENNPLAEPTTITDDTVITDEPIEEDVSNLLISSVTSVNNLDELGMSSPAQSTSSLDIQADPLLENSEVEENSITSDIPEQDKNRPSGEVEVANPQNSQPNESVISDEKQNDTEPSKESQEPSSVTENQSTPQEPLVESSVSLDQDPMELEPEKSNLRANEGTLDGESGTPQDPMELEPEKSNLQANEGTLDGDSGTPQEPLVESSVSLDQDPMELEPEKSNLQDDTNIPQEPLEDPMEFDQDNSNLVSEEATSVSSTNGLTSDDPLAARAALSSENSVENGIENDPFNQDNLEEDLENSINDLLQSNPLENGSSEEPTLLDDDDANDLLDQLVDFQAGKSISEDDSNKNNSESATSQ